MKDKIRVLIFGASGIIGKNLVRKLTEADYIVTCQTRNRHKSISLMTQGPPGGHWLGLGQPQAGAGLELVLPGGGGAPPLTQ